ncbi:MAG: hypothetical protein ACXVPU_03285 [Bacteroidia bacterium]
MKKLSLLFACFGIMSAAIAQEAPKGSRTQPVKAPPAEKTQPAPRVQPVDNAPATRTQPATEPAPATSTTKTSPATPAAPVKHTNVRNQKVKPANGTVSPVAEPAIKSEK